MDEQTESSLKTLIKTRLQDQVWHAADSIVGGYNSTSNYSDSEMAAYARGVQHTVWKMAEDVGVEVCTIQLQGAMGERLRRANSDFQKPKSVAIRRSLDAIRDKRIAMLDRYEDLDYRSESRSFQKRVWALERKGYGQEHYDDFDRLQTELRALRQLSTHLISDRSWYQKHFEMKMAAAGQAQGVAA